MAVKRGQPWGRIIVEELTVPQLLKKFVFCGIRMFITS
jgi:hypothetical protein